MKSLNFAYFTSYLGFFIEKNLIFIKQIETECSKWSENNWFWHIFFAPSFLNACSYNALIFPYLKYCNAVWAGTANRHKDFSFNARACGINKYGLGIPPAKGYLVFTQLYFFGNCRLSNECLNQLRVRARNT